MQPDLTVFAWTAAPQAVEALARRSRLLPVTASAAAAAGDAESACRQLGLEAEPVCLNAGQAIEQLAGAAPCVVRLPGSEDLFLAVVGFRRRHALVLAPDLAIRRVNWSMLRDLLCRDVEAPLEAEIDGILAVAGTNNRRARSALLRERLRRQSIGTAWQLRARPGSSFPRQLRESGVARRMVRLATAHVAEYALWLISWWMIGSAALSGRIDWGWLGAWLLTLATIVPVRVLANWSQSTAGIGLGGLLKQRLLAGALELSPEDIRLQGTGQLLGCAMEAETVESLALTGGLAGAVAALEVGMAAAVLAVGAGGPVHALLLVGWVGIAALLAWRFGRARVHWTGRRLEMTHDLVERMNGHRTRLAQLPPEQWHHGEDEALDAYLAASQAMDRRRALLLTLVPRGWLIAGICGMARAFVAGGVSAGPRLAVALGGVLLAHQALQRLTAAATQLADAGIAWRRVGPLFRAAEKDTDRSACLPTAPRKSHTVVEAHDLTFRYPGHTEPALRGANLRIERGDWLLLEGPSGGGKSTLAALLAGLRSPASGLLLSGGLDRAALGANGWRKWVAAAPQYHENHILTGPLAFNLLMGRNWPPAWQDLEEAEAVCRELGLGDLLARMPAGLMQVVGESGWQLSQGERSRIFLARALLQKPELLLLDESFAALDPENLRQSLECVLRRTETLLVVAHP